MDLLLMSLPEAINLNLPWVATCLERRRGLLPSRVLEEVK